MVFELEILISSRSSSRQIRRNSVLWMLVSDRLVDGIVGRSSPFMRKRPRSALRCTPTVPGPLAEGFLANSRRACALQGTESISVALD